MPFLEHVGVPDKLVKLLENSQSGYALTAYAMYKVGYHFTFLRLLLTHASDRGTLENFLKFQLEP